MFIHPFTLTGGYDLMLIALLLTSLFITAPALALETDAQQPLFIEADAVELDEPHASSRYLGNVEIQQGSLRIFAAEVVVRHRANRQPQHIVATGQPARYRQRMDGETNEVHGQALRMEYDADRDELTLIDKAVLTQGQDRFSSDRIIYNRVTKQVRAGGSAQGRARVKISIHPAAEKSPAAAQPAPKSRTSAK
ncbi:lipopolysaccharide transport periplasmic protein LptA [Rhodoferax sp. 4810]|uniref:Lipopolysaccharide export system protein LptA n=1 Tax=Thiospirillum jenense TaxID=1653858 RepID=A0A839HA23_9GAMM|nr:lipopolysaccharide transport periplasmic protein LptA [Thiospirillum jenense]MBB1073547.1 lipopolysaccharide transport periplasmic protein LptA [Rhodoferax jenense]MBB1126035.1 lipopolysaccharide transport periplasmic protein LptA [Thiospirillum jenense]